MFDMDEGAGGGSKGPWLSWKARGNRNVARESFELRDEDGNKSQADFMSRGVVADIDNLKTGWQLSTGQPGVAPEWRWNESISRMMPKPGDEWKRGFSLRCAVNATESVNWEDSSAGAWNALTRMKEALNNGSRQNPGKLPVIRMAGAQAIKFGKGDTSIPIFEIVKWVDRPDALNASLFDEGDDGGAGAASSFDERPFNPQPVRKGPKPSQPAAAAATDWQAPPQAAPQQPVSAMEDGAFIDDEIPF